MSFFLLKFAYIYIYINKSEKNYARSKALVIIARTTKQKNYLYSRKYTIHMNNLQLKKSYGLAQELIGQVYTIWSTKLHIENILITIMYSYALKV